MSLIKSYLFFIYLTFTKRCSHYSNIDANQHSDVSECAFRQQHPVFVGHPNHLPLRGSEAPGPRVDRICPTGAHHPGNKGIRGRRGRGVPAHISLNFKITHGRRKHLGRPHSEPPSAVKNKYWRTLSLNWCSLITSAR